MQLIGAFPAHSQNTYPNRPFHLGNFQGYHECSQNVLIGRPQTVSELRDIVIAYDFVKVR